MARILVCLAVAAAASSPASADDRAECTNGIAMLQAELPRSSGDTRRRVERELRVALREQGEGEFDECVDAIRAARKALGR